MRYVHTNIIARDWPSLADFYAQVFECEFVPPERNQAGNWLARGTGVAGAALEGVHLLLPGHGPTGPTLEIYSYRQMLDGPPVPAANRRGLGHLAFEVDDVASTLTRVLERGGSALGEITERDIQGVGKLTFVYATDPEGNILELQSWST